MTAQETEAGAQGWIVWRKVVQIHMKAQNPLLWESENTYTQIKTAFLEKSQKLW